MKNNKFVKNGYIKEIFYYAKQMKWKILGAIWVLSIDKYMEQSWNGNFIEFQAMAYRTEKCHSISKLYGIFVKN